MVACDGWWVEERGSARRRECEESEGWELGLVVVAGERGPPQCRASSQNWRADVEEILMDCLTVLVLLVSGRYDLNDVS